MSELIPLGILFIGLAVCQLTCITAIIVLLFDKIFKTCSPDSLHNIFGKMWVTGLLITIIALILLSINYFIN